MHSRTILAAAGVTAGTAVLITLIVMLPNIIGAFRITEVQPVSEQVPAGNVVSCNDTSGGDPGPGPQWCPVRWEGADLVVQYTNPVGPQLFKLQPSGR